MGLNLNKVGLEGVSVIHRNQSASCLIEHALNRREGLLSNRGVLVIETGKYTGRSPEDKYIVLDEVTKESVWWTKGNVSISPQKTERIRKKIVDHLNKRELFVQDSYAGASSSNRLRVRVIAERAWHALFAQNMFIEPSKSELVEFEPEFTVLHAPGLKMSPETDGTNSEAVIIIDFSNKQVLICGTEYAGEIKKSIFSVLNFLLPQKNILGMHCSANMGLKNDVTLFFGLSGTGKTTLSADPKRRLIGDDEHGWDDSGIFNFEGGCYAKVIRLGPKEEPEIYKTTQTFGTLLENVVIDLESRTLDLDSSKLTENTRASYPISQISNALLDGAGGHPKHIVMLTCDAFGVLPPLAKLTKAQAMYHFISGYTAKVAGTERGITEPTAAFSTCFGAPFMPRHPQVYAKLLGEKIEDRSVDCWLVNTGWTGGPFGIGSRVKINWTRALLEAALSGALDNTEFTPDPFFKIAVPTHVEGVPNDILKPRESWQDTKAYDEQARKLVNLFHENFRVFENKVSQEIIAASPKCDY